MKILQGGTADLCGEYRVRNNSIGYWLMNTDQQRPSWWHRMWIRVLLGWQWKDSK